MAYDDALTHPEHCRSVTIHLEMFSAWVHKVGRKEYQENQTRKKKKKERSDLSKWFIFDCFSNAFKL